MDFNTTRHFTTTELIDLDISQNLATKISNYIGDAKSNGHSPADCATALCEVIDLIRELNSNIPDLYKIFCSAEAMETHLKRFKED